MNIKIIAMCWIKNKQSAHEIVEINEDQLMDVLRGKSKAIFKTPVEDQYHWELREVSFS